MDAVILRQAGIALLVDYDQTWMIRVDDDKPTVVRHEDIPYILNERSDLVYTESQSLQQIKKQLHKAKNECDAFTRCLTSMDPLFSIELRRELAQAAEKLLCEEGSAEYVANVLSACPFPEQADVKGTIDLCKTDGLGNFLEILVEMQRRQPAISLVYRTWQALPLSIFGSQEERQWFQSVAVREGLFRTLSTEINDPNVAGTFLVLSLRNPAISSFEFYKLVIRWWVATVEEFNNSNISNQHSPVTVAPQYPNSKRLKSATLDGIVYSDLARLAQSAVAQIHGGEGTTNIFSTTCFLSDPLVMMNKEAVAVRVGSGPAFI